MTIDFATLLFASAMLSCIAVLPFWVLARVIPGDEAGRRWLLGVVFLVVAAVSTAGRPWLPVSLSLFVGSLAYVTAMALLVEGVLRFRGAPWRDESLLGFLALSGAGLGVLVALRGPAHVDVARVITTSLLVAGVLLLGAWRLARLTAGSAPSRLMVWAFALSGAVSAARAVAAWRVGAQPDIELERHWVHSALILAQLCAFLAKFSGLSLLVAARLAQRAGLERDALDAQRRRLQAVMDSTPGIMWEADPRTLMMTFVSQRAEEVLGYTVAEWMAPGFWETHLHPDDAEDAVRECSVSTEGGEDHQLDYRFLAKDGRVVWLRDIVHVRTDQEGRPVSLHGVFVDITESKQLEQDLRVAKEHAERADKAKSRFLAQMSHELRTPMNGVVALLDVALSGELSAEQRENLTVAGQSAARLMQILDDILDVSRIEAGQVALQPEAISPRELLRGLEGLFLAQAKAKGLALKLELDLPARVRLDGRYVGQIVTNLLSNAVKYTEDGGVTLRARLGRGRPRAVVLQIEVEDTGPGIPPDLREAVFQAFDRGEEGQSKSGVGLGLAISRQLAELMGGTLSAHAGVGGGALFRLRLPIEVLTDPAEPAATLPPLSKQDYVVLVVEDDSINRFVFERMFAALELEISTAGSGEEALEMIDGGLKPDVMFVDIRLPGINGHETARRARAKLGEACPPLVALTANAYAEDRQAAKDAGMEHFLEKPLRLDALRNVIATLERGFKAAQRP